MSRFSLAGTGGGWVVFSAMILVMAGIFGVINGITALVVNEVYVVTEDEILAFDFTVWGIIHLAIGILAVLAGFSVLSGEEWARFAGVVMAMASAIAHIAYIFAFPLWSVVVIGIDVFVLYGLLVAWEQAKEPAGSVSDRATG
jgi:hypothetical protein